MLRLVLYCCAGAGAVQFLPELPTAPVQLLIALIAAGAWRHSRGLAALCLAFAWTAHGAGQLLARDWPCARDREDLPLTVRVVAPAVTRDGRVELDLRVLEPRGPGAPQGRLRLSWYDAPVVPRPGQDWRVTARLRCRSGGKDRLHLARGGHPFPSPDVGRHFCRAVFAGANDPLGKVHRSTVRSLDVVRLFRPGGCSIACSLEPGH